MIQINASSFPTAHHMLHPLLSVARIKSSGRCHVIAPKVLGSLAQTAHSSVRDDARPAGAGWTDPTRLGGRVHREGGWRAAPFGAPAGTAYAQADYELVNELHEEGLLGTYDAAIVIKRADGMMTVTNEHNSFACPPRLTGLAVGALLGIIFPPSIVGAPAVGRGVPRAAGSVTSPPHVAM